jgi:hypothetical protein
MEASFQEMKMLNMAHALDAESRRCFIRPSLARASDAQGGPEHALSL